MSRSEAPHGALDQRLPWWLHPQVGVALLLGVVAVVYNTTMQMATLSVTQSPSERGGTQASAKPVSTLVSSSATASSASATSVEASEVPRSKLSHEAAFHARRTVTREVRDPGAQAQRSGDRRRQEVEAERRTSRRQVQLAAQRQAPLEVEREATVARVALRERRADRQLAALLQSLAATPEGWVSPVSDAYRITATFGARGSMWSNTHTGVDLAAPTGTPVRAVAPGTVTFAADNGAYGLRVAIQHADGVETWYAHLSSIAVEVGQTVPQGAPIGAIGVTGNVTGPHLHLELRPGGGAPVDPVQALRVRGATL